MAEAKTQKTTASVPAFLKKAAKGDRLADCQQIVKIMEKATGAKAAMWGTAIVGFDSYGVVYADGHTEDWPLVAFSPRSTSLVLYMARRYPKYEALAKKLGKHKQAGGCLHIKSLADVDVKVLTQLVNESVKARRKKA
jgi:hypothetical protein